MTDINMEDITMLDDAVPDDAMSEASAPSAYDASASASNTPIEETIKGTNTKLRKFLERHAKSNIKIIQILRAKAKTPDIDITARDHVVSLVEEYQELINTICHEERELKMQPRLQNHVAYTQAVKLRIEISEAGLEQRVCADADASGHSEMAGYIKKELALQERNKRIEKAAKIKKAKDAQAQEAANERMRKAREANQSKVTALPAEGSKPKPKWAWLSKQTDRTPLKHKQTDGAADEMELD